MADRWPWAGREGNRFTAGFTIEADVMRSTDSLGVSPLRAKNHGVHKEFAAEITTQRDGISQNREHYGRSVEIASTVGGAKIVLFGQKSFLWSHSL